MRCRKFWSERKCVLECCWFMCTLKRCCSKILIICRSSLVQIKKGQIIEKQHFVHADFLTDFKDMIFVIHVG